MEAIFNWLDEYSTIKQKQKDEIDFVRQMKFVEQNKDSSTVVTSSIMNLSEDCLATIEHPTFDIFRLENEVGQENTLSTVSCYVFISLGFTQLLIIIIVIIFYHQFQKGIKEIILIIT